MGSIDLRKKTYSKTSFKKVINTEFTTFTKTLLEDPVTIQEFFNLYENLFLSIPIEGDIESHEYLIKRSSELFNFERDTQDIEPLLDEIAKLRERLLTSNQRINELRIQLLNLQITPIVEEQESSINTSLDSTEESVEIVGCMDERATNYNPNATVPCTRCCTYPNSRTPGGSTSRDSSGGRSTGASVRPSVEPDTLLRTR